MASPDVRVRVRESVIRVRISETAIRAVIRITAPQDQLILLYLPLTPVGFTFGSCKVRVALCCATFALLPWFFPRKVRGFSNVSKNRTAPHSLVWSKLHIQLILTIKSLHHYRTPAHRNKQGEPRSPGSRTRKRDTRPHKRDRNARRNSQNRPT